MSLPSKVNKENFRLLDLSSDEESEDLQLEIIPSRKKKITRRERNRNPTPRASEPSIGAEVQCAIRWAAKGTLFLWLLMLTWICASMYDHVASMQMQVDKVSTTSQGATDELQICHSAVKLLQTNATDFRDKIDGLRRDYTELVKRIEKTEKALEGVSGQLDATPGLRETPQKLSSLQKLVADFGAQLSNYDAVITAIKKQASTAQSGVEDVKTQLHQLDSRTNETIANVSANAKQEDEIKLQVSAVNATLEGKVESLRTKIEDLTKTTSTVPPTTTSTTTTTPSTTTIATNTTSASIPGPPAKPSVLQ